MVFLRLVECRGRIYDGVEGSIGMINLCKFD
jgi:hypothetical protein